MPFDHDDPNSCSQSGGDKGEGDTRSWSPPVSDAPESGSKPDVKPPHMGDSENRSWSPPPAGRTPNR